MIETVKWNRVCSDINEYGSVYLNVDIDPLNKKKQTICTHIHDPIVGPDWG